MKSDHYKKTIRLISVALISFLVVLFCVSEKVMLNPHYGAVFYRFGMECQKECSLRKRLEYFQKAIYHAPTLSDAYYQLGVVYGEMGNREKEIESYRRGARIDYKHQKIWTKIGIDYYKKGDRDYALRYLIHAFHLGEISPVVNYYLALIYEESDDYENAIKYYLQACKYDYNYGHHQLHPVYVKIGVLSHSLGKDEIALDQVKWLRRIGEDNLANQLDEYLRLGSYPEEIMSYDPVFLGLI